MAMQTTELLAIEKLTGDFGGQLIQPDDAAYDEARKIYNGMIDRRPSLIARPAGTADVIATVNFARENELPIAVRCGGHSVAGHSMPDEGVLLDLSLMKGVTSIASSVPRGRTAACSGASTTERRRRSVCIHRAAGSRPRA